MYIIHRMDYSRTELYILSHNVDKNKDVYIGHTTNWKNRKREHSYNTRCISSNKYYTKKYVYIRDNDGWENWSMELIETYPCLSFYEATKRETYWVKFYNEVHKKYFEKNKEKIREKCRLRAKGKKTCDICGNVVNMSAMSRHKNSFTCKNFICQ